MSAFWTPAEEGYTEVDCLADLLPRTITEALLPESNHPDKYKLYQPYLRMTRRLLGDEPSFYPILTLSRVAINTHVGLFARMFGCPEIDMRLPNQLSPSNRQIAFVTASETFDCDYCIAHAHCFGDMMRGSKPSQARRGAKKEFSVRTADEVAVQQFSKQAVRRPYVEAEVGPTLDELSREVKGHVGARALESAKAIIAFAGALNTVMDIQGVTLEPGAQSYAIDVKGDENWVPNDHHFNPSEEALKRIKEPEQEQGALSGTFSNMKDLMKTMPSAMSAMKFEASKLYHKIPRSREKLDRWVENRLGMRRSLFFKNIHNVEIKRAFCFGLRENVFADVNCQSGEHRAWTLAERIRFLYQFATVTGSEELQDIAVDIYRRFLWRKNAQQDLENFVEGTGVGLTMRAIVGQKLTIAVAEKMDNISPLLVAQLVNVCEPEAILELASMLSFFEMWRRMSLLFLINDSY
mmetsp:Transcript_2901/g.8867  ORF Transcript_2901/g.8867 Transcript_2901/m.8867 type:complete len:465 (-) Transcript_2901:150-1544(-)